MPAPVLNYVQSPLTSAAVATTTSTTTTTTTTTSTTTTTTSTTTTTTTTTVICFLWKNFLFLVFFVHKDLHKTYYIVAILSPFQVIL